MKTAPVFLILILTSMSSFASYDQILDLAGEYNNQKKSVFNLESEKQKVLAKLYSIEKETSTIARDKSKLKSDEISLNNSLKTISTEIVDLERRITEIAKVLSDRWDLMQKIQNVPWIYIFLASESPAELEQTQYFLKNLNEKELALAADYIASIEKLKTQKRDLRKVARKLIKVKQQLAIKENNLKKQHLIKQEMVGSLEKKIKIHKSRLIATKQKGLVLSNNSKLDDFKILFATSFFDKKGRLPHPVNAPVAHDFSFNRSCKSPMVKLLHKGIFYKSIAGQSVKAIAPGRISFFEGVKDMGYVAIIDHGSNYYSVYSNLSSQSKKIADNVKAGDVIGLTGNQSRQFNEGLYFEIRHFAEPENPDDWLQKNKHFDELANKLVDREGET